MKQLSLPELLELFDPEVHQRLESLSSRPGASLVVYESRDLSSSRLGDRTALLVGPGCTYSSVAEAPAWLGDLPSERQQAIAFFSRLRCDDCGTLTPSAYTDS
jgi:hypothetical protein